MRSWGTIALLVALLVASVGVALWVWREIGAIEMSVHGLIALALGAGATLALGAGLMALMFFSARRGYDDRANESEGVHVERWRPRSSDDD